MQNDFVVIKLLIFQYCDNIIEFSLLLLVKLSLLMLFASLLVQYKINFGKINNWIISGEPISF